MKWEPVPRGSLNGQLIGYRVRYRQTFSNGSDGEIITLTKKLTTTKATLTGLDKASVYRIEVAGETSEGTGIYSEPVSAKTSKSKTA